MPTTARPSRVLVSALLAGAVVIGVADRAQANCTCRAEGRSFELGTTMCLKSPQGPRLARCEMALNNTSWRWLQEGCPVTGRVAPMTTALVMPHGDEDPPSALTDDR